MHLGRTSPSVFVIVARRAFWIRQPWLRLLCTWDMRLGKHNLNSKTFTRQNDYYSIKILTRNPCYFCARSTKCKISRWIYFLNEGTTNQYSCPADKAQVWRFNHRVVFTPDDCAVTIRPGVFLPRKRGKTTFLYFLHCCSLLWLQYANGETSTKFSYFFIIWQE